MPFVSIIVPVYNVEKYLDECVQSILKQDCNDIELILVDDGSEDESLKMCDRYEDENSFIKVIHKKNGGLSSARNAGLKIATGEYILYVDSDDSISQNYISEMKNIVSRNDFDMIIGNTLTYLDGTDKNHSNQNKFMTFSPVETMEHIYYQNLFDTNACAKLIKREIAYKHPFKDSVLYEDFDIIHEIVFSCEKIAYTSNAEYYYRTRKDSIMSGAFNPKKFYLLDIADKHLNFIDKNYPSLRPAVIRRYEYSYFHILGRIVNDKNYLDKCKEMRKKMLVFKDDILNNNQVSVKEKLSIIFLAMGLNVYRFFWNLFCVIKGKNVNF